MERVTYKFTGVAQSTDGHTHGNGVCNIYIPGTLETLPSCLSPSKCVLYHYCEATESIIKFSVCFTVLQQDFEIDDSRK